MCKASTLGIAATTAVDYSHRLYTTPRAVRFQEMEYNMPVERFAEVMGEIERRITKGKFRVNFPLECRFVKGDDIWLSPAYGRDSAYIAAHMFKGMPYREYFAALEEIFQRYDGRPHWGKLHTLTAATLSQRYPHWDDFRRVRAALDPNGVFLNDYLRTLLGADAPVAPSIVPVAPASVPAEAPVRTRRQPHPAHRRHHQPVALETTSKRHARASRRRSRGSSPSSAPQRHHKLPRAKRRTTTQQRQAHPPHSWPVSAASDTAAQEGVPFKPGWWGTDLGRYRACDGTYCFFPYESLPPLTNFDGTLSWLGALPDHLDAQMEVHRNDPSERGQIDALADQARQLGLTLPPAFVELMGSSELQDRIPSCTACYFKLSERILPCPAAEQGYILRFLNDQQDVLLWYLYLTPDGDARVLVSPYELRRRRGADRRGPRQRPLADRRVRANLRGVHLPLLAGEHHLVQAQRGGRYLHARRASLPRPLCPGIKSSPQRRKGREGSQRGDGHVRIGTLWCAQAGPAWSESKTACHAPVRT